jgi:hypothetical protein
MEFINAGITFDGSGIQAGMKDAADAIKKGGDEIGKAAETAATKSDFAFKSLAQAYRQTSKDAQYLAETQGINSKAFLEAATKAGQYKNKLDDVKLAVDALGADKPVLQSTLNLAQGIAGGFAAAQGAMALFGGKSKEVDEALKKVQGSLALLQGLQAVAGLADAWAAFSVVLKTSVIPALMTTRGILMTTGIGAIAVVVGYLAMKWYEEANAEEEATKKHKEFLEAHFKDAQFAQETQTLLTNAQADSLKKRLALQDQANLKEQTDLTQKFKNNEITQLQYNSRMQALEISNQAKLAEIRTNWAKEHPTVSNIVRKETQIQEIQGRGFFQMPTFAPEKLPPIIGDNFLQDTGKRFNSLKQLAFDVSDEIGDKFKDLAQNKLAEVGTMIGQSLMGAETDLTKSAWGIVSAFATVLGQSFISIGTLSLAAGNYAKGAAMIAAGVGIMAIAGAAGAASSGGSSGSSAGAGGYNGATGAGTFQPQTSFFSATGILYGNDMLLAIQKSNQKMQRVK